MPRELTEEEIEFEKNRLLENGKKLLFRYGIRRVSVDDIAKESGIAKGSFYNFFTSKDDFIYEVIYQLHDELFLVFEKGLHNIAQIPKNSQREAITKLFIEFMTSPEIEFFTIEHSEINSFLARYSKEALIRVEKLEEEKYKELFSKLGIKDKKIEIVQNYIHIIVFGIMRKEFLNEEYINQTVKVLFEGLLNYLEVYNVSI